jgi:hypothetical protein
MENVPGGIQDIGNVTVEERGALHGLVAIGRSSEAAPIASAARMKTAMRIRKAGIR